MLLKPLMLVVHQLPPNFIRTFIGTKSPKENIQAKNGRKLLPMEHPILISSPPATLLSNIQQTKKNEWTFKASNFKSKPGIPYYQHPSSCTTGSENKFLGSKVPKFKTLSMSTNSNFVFHKITTSRLALTIIFFDFALHKFPNPLTFFILPPCLLTN